MLRARQQAARNKIDAAEKYPEIKNKETREKVNTIFNEVRQFAYVLRARERDFIDSITNTICCIPFKRVLTFYL